MAHLAWVVLVDLVIHESFVDENLVKLKIFLPNIFAQTFNAK